MEGATKFKRALDKIGLEICDIGCAAKIKEHLEIDRRMYTNHYHGTRSQYSTARAVVIIKGPESTRALTRNRDEYKNTKKLQIKVQNYSR